MAPTVITRPIVITSTTTYVIVDVSVIGPVIVAVHVNVNPTVEVIDAVVGDS